MQVPSSALAASISVATSSNSKAERATTADATINAPIQLEKSGESSADRDAQGQADGMGDRGSRKKAALKEPSSTVTPAESVMPAPTLPDEPPSQLDLLG